MVTFRSNASFEGEAGGHRWQRIPPTERKGRVQTSTITVAVLPEPKQSDVQVDEKDIEWTAVRGTGAGGQHKNVTNSCVVVRHKPTGLEARSQSERSQHQNRASAMAVLRARIWNKRQSGEVSKIAQNRREQIGSGMRGDKRRTIRVQAGEVIDHISGQRWDYKSYCRGDW